MDDSVVLEQPRPGRCWLAIIHLSLGSPDTAVTKDDLIVISGEWDLNSEGNMGHKEKLNPWWKTNYLLNFLHAQQPQGKKIKWRNKILMKLSVDLETEESYRKKDGLPLLGRWHRQWTIHLSQRKKIVQKLSKSPSKDKNFPFEDIKSN